MPKDYHELPKLRDSISYIYAEHGCIEQSDSSIILLQEDGQIPIPVSSTTCLILGPGTRVTHAAVKTMAENGCMVIWSGEKLNRFYACGQGETRSAVNILTQARLCMDENAHLAVVRRMYERRFPKLPDKTLTIKQIRGMEGIRVKQAYMLASRTTGIPWKGRDYKQTSWDEASDINRALSTANALLYGVCHAGIVSLGYSPALGFVHTGKMLSFVYDVADLYKADTSIPAAFEAVKENNGDLERQVRIACRRRIARFGVLKRMADDIAWIFDVASLSEHSEEKPVGDLWDEEGSVGGGINYAQGVTSS